MFRRPNAANRRGIGYNAVSASGFDPFSAFTSANGAVLWLRADLGITLSGGDVSAWADQSGSGNHASQGTAAWQPVYNSTDANFNGQPSVQGNGTNEFIFANGASTFLGAAEDRGYTLALVMRWTTWTGRRPAMWGSSIAGGSTYGIVADTVSNSYSMIRNTASPPEFRVHPFTTNYANTNPHIYIWEDTGAAQSIRCDGVAGAPNGAINASAPNTLDRFTLFAQFLSSQSNQAPVSIAEAVVWDHTVHRPDSGDLAEYEAYFMDRYL